MGATRSSQREFKHKYGTLALRARAERHAAVVLLFDDTARQRQADPPAARLAGDAGLEQLALHFRRDAGAIIAHARAPAGRGAFDLDLDPPAPTAHRVDGSRADPS